MTAAIVVYVLAALSTAIRLYALDDEAPWQVLFWSALWPLMLPMWVWTRVENWRDSREAARRGGR